MTRRDLAKSAVVVALVLKAVYGAACGATEVARRAADGEKPAGIEPADLVLKNGEIYTLDAARSWAEAVAVRGDRLVFVGSNHDVAPFVGAKTRVVDLGGRFVLPGFHDSHVHLLSGGVELGQCDLNGSQSVEQILARVRACAAANPSEEAWIVGGGWDLPLFPQANPHRELLDRAVPNRPIYLSAADGHSVWVSSKALAIAGVTKETPDPPHGRIERDASGVPSGTLREDAIASVADHLPEISAEERLRGLARGVARAHEFGLVSIQEASAGEEALATFRTLDERGQLGLRAVLANGFDPEKGVAQIADFVTRRDGDATKRAPHVRATAVKIFADGVIEAGTAALLVPYVGARGEGGYRGTLELEAARFAEATTALDRAGFQIHIHAIGDAAIRASLDALEAARRANGPRDARPLLAHIQLFDPADIPRFRRLGAIASFQPLWAYADPYIVELTEPQLGAERSRWLYPIGSLARSGAVLAAGSDWSVSSLDPLDAIEVAVTRCAPEAPSCEKPWLPEQRVDLATILAAYTIGGAYANFEEKESGSLEAGKLADLIVLDKNLFEIPPLEIDQAKVLVTMFEGRVVFGGW